MQKGNTESAGKNSAKLPGFMQRTVLTSKPNGQSIGTISFNTKQDEDISGLDEAMQTFRPSAGNSTTAKPESASPLVANTTSSVKPANEAASNSDFELAIEATAVGDDSIGSATLVISGSAKEDADCDSHHSAGDRDSVVEPSDQQGCTELGGGLPSPDLRTAAHALEIDPASANRTPRRPPAFVPRSQGDKANVVVAASEIHALLDSFSPPKHVISPDELPPDTNSPVRHNNTSASLLASRASTQELDKQCVSFELEDDSRDADSIRPVTRSRSGSRSPSCASVNGLGELPELTKRFVSPPKRLVSPGLHAPASEHFREQPQMVHNRRTRSNRSSGFDTRSGFHLLAVLALLTACFYLLSAFFWGLACGIAGAYLFLLIRRMIWGDPSHFEQTRCPISGSPLDMYCCSLHSQLAMGLDLKDHYWPVYAPALPPLGFSSGPPQLRELQSLTVPHMTDEDPNSSAAGGPLSTGLGFKLDKSDRPIYRGWMNETLSYDPETHHVSQTHSIFVTLEGTQLRLQRPRRNIARRSMWNEELPPNSAVRFQQQRIFDLVHARVTLLPAGLVSKRLWSKKYPISITIPKNLQSGSGARPTLPSSTSVPNMMTASLSQGSSPTRTASINSAVQASEVHARSRSPTPAGVTDVAEDFTVVSHRDIPAETLYLFGRTCREKETWYARLRAASLGIPLLWTPQLAVQTYLAAANAPASTTGTAGSGDNRSDDETNADRDSQNSAIPGSDATCSSTDKSSAVPLASQLPIPGTREPLYVTYVRYMAKFMPASWLLRGTQALRLNVNHVSCDSSLMWLNALLARVFWDFLREVYWLERVRDKIQAKLKKIHLPPFISDLIVVGIDLGSELPVIRRMGKPFLDAHGLWFELDIAYAGGFSVALETNVNLMRWNQKNRESANLADDLSSTSPPPVLTSDQNFNSFARRSNRLGAFLSDEEDSADSTTDSDAPVEPAQPATINMPGLRRASGSGRLLAPSAGSPSLAARAAGDEERTVGSDSPLNLPSALPSRRRFIRIVDRITRSTYFQKAVDNKLVQRGMELLSNTPIVLEAEIQMLTGTLLVNIPPPPSDRLWYGFRPNPQLRLKARPRVGEKAVTMSRILEWIEKRVALEFQRLIVLPNMDDISIPLLLSDVTAG